MIDLIIYLLGSRGPKLNLFQYDNDPVNNAKSIKTWFAKGQNSSTDLNPSDELEC